MQKSPQPIRDFQKQKEPFTPDTLLAFCTSMINVQPGDHNKVISTIAGDEEKMKLFTTAIETIRKRLGSELVKLGLEQQQVKEFAQREMVQIAPTFTRVNNEMPNRSEMKQLSARYIHCVAIAKGIQQVLAEKQNDALPKETPERKSLIEEEMPLLTELEESEATPSDPSERMGKQEKKPRWKLWG